MGDPLDALMEDVDTPQGADLEAAIAIAERDLLDERAPNLQRCTAAERLGALLPEDDPFIEQLVSLLAGPVELVSVACMLGLLELARRGSTRPESLIIDALQTGRFGERDARLRETLGSIRDLALAQGLAGEDSPRLWRKRTRTSCVPGLTSFPPRWTSRGAARRPSCSANSSPLGTPSLRN